MIKVSADADTNAPIYVYVLQFSETGDGVSAWSELE